MVLRSLTVVSFVLAAWTLGMPAQAGHSSLPQVPCADSRGCPDLVVDETRFVLGWQRVESFAPESCSVQEGMIEAGDRQVIRFTFNTPNLGAGDLVVGSPSAHPEWFEYSSCHGHHHFAEYADYRLWTLAGYEQWDALRSANPDQGASNVLADHPELLPHFVAGHKQGFCVIDVVPAPATVHGGAVVPDPLPKYLSCGFNQGISRGWADEYTFLLAGQWIDVTDVPSGAYVLEAEVNAEHLYEESSYANNRASLHTVVADVL